MSVPELSFEHLSRLTTATGLFEHALFTEPRHEHGYCLDDVARGLVVVARQPDTSEQVCHLTEVYLRFTVDAQDSDGRFHNRRGLDGGWEDAASLDDHWGRALWGLGTAAAYSVDDRLRDLALSHASIGFRARSRWPRAMSYAALGASEVLRASPGDRGALDLLTDVGALLGRPGPDPSWPWPEPRLTYANAVLPEALLVVGSALDDAAMLRDGLALLSWLLEQETVEGHLSVTPAGGWRAGDPRPGFDQQPIEVSALAEACWRAFELTRDDVWLTGVDRAVAWFLGDNDSGLALYDPASGGGRDGLHAFGVNENQGAESTLALLATFQLGRLALMECVR